MNYSNKRIVEKPLKTEWCLDQTEMNAIMSMEEELI